jgi:hypothetical protein
LTARPSTILKFLFVSLASQAELKPILIELLVEKEKRSLDRINFLSPLSARLKIRADEEIARITSTIEGEIDSRGK